jgi:hypothetical protein
MKKYPPHPSCLFFFTFNLRHFIYLLSNYLPILCNKKEKEVRNYDSKSGEKLIHWKPGGEQMIQQEKL